MMTHSIKLIQSLDTPITTKRERIQPLKSRRQRRQEERERISLAQVNSQRKVG